MLCLKPGWLPAGVGILLATGGLVCYVISVSRGDVTPLIPFISETGGDMPQSGIFSIFMIFTSFSSMVAMHVRFLLVKELLEGNICGLVTNYIALGIGIISSTGLIVVAAYPMTTIEVAHDVGAYTTFVLGVVYAFLQTSLTYKLYPDFNGIFICRVRLLLAMLSLTSVVVLVVFYIMAQLKWSSTKQIRIRSKRQPGDKGYEEFIIAASAEWALALFYIFYFFTFIREFQKIYVQLSARILVKHFDDDASLTASWDNNDETRPILDNQNNK